MASSANDLVRPVERLTRSANDVEVSAKRLAVAVFQSGGVGEASGEPGRRSGGLGGASRTTGEASGGVGEGGGRARFSIWCDRRTIWSHRRKT